MIYARISLHLDQRYAQVGLESYEFSNSIALPPLTRQSDIHVALLSTRSFLFRQESYIAKRMC